MKVKNRLVDSMKDYHYKGHKHSKMAPKGGDTECRDSSTQGISEAIQAQPLEVKVYGNNFEKAIKAFRALVQKERILSAYKETQTYEKPSDKRRRKRNETKRKAMELESKNTHQKV
jgi:small subunit ribosomal protein S21